MHCFTLCYDSLHAVTLYNPPQMQHTDNAKMNNGKSILKNIIDGMANALVLHPDNDYIRPDKRGFSRDAANLRGDFKNVANDLRKTTLNYGENYNG